MTAALTIPLGEQTLPDTHFVERLHAPALPGWLLSGDRPTGETGCVEAEHVFTDDRVRAPHVRESILALIRSARDRVFFSSFLFADSAIVEALVEAAERLRGGVYVLTALERGLRADLSDLGELDRRAEIEQARREQHTEHLRRLARAGVWLRGAECHAKFCVIDDKRAVVTSANATPEAYERNPENGLVIRERDACREIGRLFAHVFLTAFTHESTPGDELDVRKAGARVVRPWRPLRPFRSLTPIATIDGAERSLLRRTLDVIEGAKEELVVASYSLVAIEKHPVGRALREALTRGVRVAMLLRPRNANEPQRAACTWLFDGIPTDRWCLRGHEFTHAKAIVADRRRAVIWTGNLDGEKGYESGVELGIETSIPSLVADVREYLVSLMHRSRWDGLVRPAAREVATSPLDGAWRLVLPRGATMAPEEIARAAQEKPTAFLETKDGPTLRVGRDLYLRVRRDDGARALVVSSVSRRASPLEPGAMFRGYVAGVVLHVERAGDDAGLPGKEGTVTVAAGE